MHTFFFKTQLTRCWEIARVIEIAQWEKCLLHEDLILVPISWVWWHILVIPKLETRGWEAGPDGYPSNLAYSLSSGPVKDLVSKNRLDGS